LLTNLFGELDDWGGVRGGGGLGRSHAPVEEVLHGRHADFAGKAFGEDGAGQAGGAHEVGDGPSTRDLGEQVEALRE
jgi:hypothetical protein